MDEEDIIREICVAIPLTCKGYNEPIRLDRIELQGISTAGWHLRFICGNCDTCYQDVLHPGRKKVKEAQFSILADRTIDEELDLRGGTIPSDYEVYLPTILNDFWKSGQKEEPQPPRTPA